MQWSGEPTLVAGVRAHRSEVTCLDACGARLATGSSDRALRLWRWRAGAGWVSAAEARAAHRCGVTAARWSHAGALLASAGVDGAVRVWSRELAARRTLAAPAAAAARALCWVGAGGARLLSGHDDGTVYLWAVSLATPLCRFEAHEGAVHALATAANDALLVTACTNGVLKVFDLVKVSGGSAAELAPLVWLDGAHDLGALCADASEDGRAVATGGHDARLCVWRAAHDDVLARAGVLEGHTAAVTAVRWGGAVLASASLDRSARLWAPDEGSCLHVVPAHPRYLTCIALSSDHRYMITGSNDKSFRMWSLGDLCIDDELELPCALLSHFGIGDLEGIGPVVDNDKDSVEDAKLKEMKEEGTGEVWESGSQCVWSAQAHAGAVNCITVYQDLLATASSDGTVKVWRRNGDQLVEEHSLFAHLYPALAVEFAANGSLLLTAGLDGCAFLWDVQSGVQVRSLSVPCGGAGGAGGETGGGGVRAARVSVQRPYMLLLGTDDGLAPLFTLADTDPDPQYVYAGHTEAVTCCAWSADGRVAATGAASGELRLLAPPHPDHLYHDSHAHDLGVLSCDFASSDDALEVPVGTYLLATAGCDSLVKIWTVTLEEEVSGMRGAVQLAHKVEAHGAAVACVRWGAGGALVSAGADRWARAWRVAAGGTRVAAAGAAPVRGAGGAGGAALLPERVLAVGSLSGELALWRLAAPAHHLDEYTPPRFWDQPAVARWLREYIVHSPGSCISPETEAILLAKAQEMDISGVDLMQLPQEELVSRLGFGEQTAEEGEEPEERSVVRERLQREVSWLRRGADAGGAGAAPHRLLCPLSHRVLREPACAADGYTYERGAMHEWLLAAPPEGAVSPMTGERLATTRLVPNYSLRDELRNFLDSNTQ